MRQILLALIFFAFHASACAWNGAGHRLVAVIAWQQLSPATQNAINEALARHPDHARWLERSGTDKAVDIFAEASTWPDDIRNDPRFYDEDREPPTPALPGLTDTARHKHWHYVDLNTAGQAKSGELDRQIERLSQILRSTGKKTEISNALPWLIHLVADIHQPLHVGRYGDEGGNAFPIENPFNKRLPQTNLHVYWDDLPGPPWLRGKRLQQNAARLLESHPAPIQGTVALWRDESHRLLAEAYPAVHGSSRPIVTEEFRQRSQDIADRRIVHAGYRLGGLLNGIFGQRMPRQLP